MFCFQTRVLGSGLVRVKYPMKMNLKRLCVLSGVVVCMGSIVGCLSLSRAPHSDLVYHCNFDSAAEVENPAVGPVGLLRNPDFRVEGDRRAMYVPVGAGVVDVELPNGLPPDRGCIEFDAKILAEKDFFRNGGDPRFFEIRAPKLSGWNFVALCDFNGNNGIGNSGLYTQIGHAVMTSQNGRIGCFPYASVPGMSDYRTWHHYSIAWNLAGVGGTSNLAEVRIDGQLVTVYPLVGMNPEFFKERMRQPSVIHFANSFDTRGIGNAKTPFLLDDFKIWKIDTPSGAVRK